MRKERKPRLPRSPRNLPQLSSEEAARQYKLVMLEDEDNNIELSDLYHPHSPYTPQQKIDAVRAYAYTGSYLDAERMTGVPETAIRWWKRKAYWWPDVIATVRKQLQDEVDGRITGIISDSLEQLKDRIENGDEVLTKDGHTYKRQMSARDLAATLSILFDKRQLIRGEPTNRVEKSSAADTLQFLKDQFIQLSQNISEKQVSGVVIENEEETNGKVK